MHKFQEEVLNRGVVVLSGEIKTESIKEAVEKILYLNIKKEVKTIDLIVNSRGGSVLDAFQLIDVMKLSKKPVNTVGMGAICSAGLLIFMTGATRSISSTASILSHQYAWGTIGKHHELIGRRKEEDLIDKRLLDVYRVHTKLSEKVIREKLLRETDTWLSAKEALQYNLADKIIKSY